jgi:hypothetical protein
MKATTEFYILDLRDTKMWADSRNTTFNLPDISTVKKFFSDKGIKLSEEYHSIVYNNGTVGVYTSDDPSSVWPEFTGQENPRTPIEELLDSIEMDYRTSISTRANDEIRERLLTNLTKLVLGIFNRQL